jgi:hypothetical protein
VISGTGEKGKGLVMTGPQGSHPFVSVVLALLVALALVACGGATSPSAAPSNSWMPGASPIPAMSIPAQQGTTVGFVTGTDGWIFRSTVDIEVTALGFYDDGRDGLVGPHRTAIFDTSDKTPIVSATIQPQSALDGAFRWESIEPVVLRAGHAYMMAWETPRPFDPEVLNPRDTSLAPELRYVGYRELLAEKETETKSIWGYPYKEVHNVILSGNFKFRPVSVASPSP